jgi:chromosome segregation ATPase
VRRADTWTAPSSVSTGCEPLHRAERRSRNLHTRNRTEISQADAFRNITGNKGKQVQQQTDELELLIVSAREERSAISTMLTALTTRSAKLMPLAKSLEQVGEKAMSVSSRLDDIARRLTALDDRTHEIEEVDKRIQALKDAAKQAEQTTQKAVGPDGELRKHREAVQQLSSQALQTQASLDTLKKERAAFEDLRGHLRDSEAEVKQAMGHAGALKGDLDQIRSTATTLTQD